VAGRFIELLGFELQVVSDLIFREKMSRSS